MKSFQLTSFVLGYFFFGLSLGLLAQNQATRVTRFYPNAEATFLPSVETKISYDELGRTTHLLEFWWNEDAQKTLQREVWIDYHETGGTSQSAVDVYDEGGSLIEHHAVWFDEQQRSIKDSTWNLADTLNPIVVLRTTYKSNYADQILEEKREIWQSSEPNWALNRQYFYTYDENECLVERLDCYSNKYETNCYITKYLRNPDCTLLEETRPSQIQFIYTANADSSERNILTLQWDLPSQEWVARSYQTTYYDQWGQSKRSLRTNFPDSSQTEFIHLQDALGNTLYSRFGTRQKNRPWFYDLEYELIEDSETYKAYRRYSQWDIDAQAYHKHSWYTTDKDTANGIWRYQELDSALVNGIWTESAYRSRRFHNYYCNGLLQRYEEYLGWDDLTQALEMRTYAYQVAEVPCQGTPSPDRLILSPNPTTDFLTFKSRDVFQMTGMTWQVVDLSGRVLQKGVFQLDDQACVDVRPLASGLYILYVGDKAAHQSYRFVKL